MQKKLFLAVALFCGASLHAQDKKYSLEEYRKKASDAYTLIKQLICGNETGELISTKTHPTVPFAELENTEHAYNIYLNAFRKNDRDLAVQHTFDRTLVARFVYGLALDNVVKTLAPRKLSSRAKNALSFITQAAVGYAAFDRTLAPALLPEEHKWPHQLLYAFKVSSAYLSAQMVSDGIRNLFTRNK